MYSLKGAHTETLKCVISVCIILSVFTFFGQWWSKCDLTLNDQSQNAAELSKVTKFTRSRRETLQTCRDYCLDVDTGLVNPASWAFINLIIITKIVSLLFQGFSLAQTWHEHVTSVECYGSSPHVTRKTWFTPLVQKCWSETHGCSPCLPQDDYSLDEEQSPTTGLSDPQVYDHDTNGTLVTHPSVSVSIIKSPDEWIELFSKATKWWHPCLVGRSWLFHDVDVHCGKKVLQGLHDRG